MNSPVFPFDALQVLAAQSNDCVECDDVCVAWVRRTSDLLQVPLCSKHPAEIPGKLVYTPSEWGWYYHEHPYE